jgi:hypothetical protein
MERSLIDKYIDCLEEYLRFLIRFTPQDENFRMKHIYPEYDNGIHFGRPMLKCEAKIKKASLDKKTKYDVRTRPSLIKVCEELFNLKFVFLDALSNIPLIETLVF